MSRIKLKIHDLGSSGEGVGYAEGATVFIPGALPGELVEATVMRKKRGISQGTLNQVLEPSPDRIQPSCPYFGQCGGCQLMHLSYDGQLLAKQQRVAAALKRIGKIEDVHVLPCIASPSPLSYRNKIQLPIQEKQGKTVLGLYAHGSHDLVEIDACLIHCPLGEQIFKQVRQVITHSGTPPFDPVTGKGVFKHLVIKSASQTGQALVILVTTVYPSAGLQQVAKQIMEQCPQVKGVIHNIQPQNNNVILGRQYIVLEGQGSIQEQILGKTFQISPAAFFQVNHAQAEQIYSKVLELAQLSGKETVLDAYCGVGTLSLILASQARQVIGVESVSEAIQDACENARLNGISNVQFTCADAENYIFSVDASLAAIDCIVLNPPRKGCEKRFLEGIGQLKPAVLIYVSCDPATLARDLAYLMSFGYQVEHVQPFDMFPQTAHVETVVKLRRS